MTRPKHKWKLIDRYPITKYQCGAQAGDRVRLRKDLVIRQGGKPTGKVYPAGQIWTVIRGAKEAPRVLWLKTPDEVTHTWDDGALFWEWFEKFQRQGLGKSHAAKY